MHIFVDTPVQVCWLNEIEHYFSILQRQVLTPNDFIILEQLEEGIITFGERYFACTFTRQELERRLREPALRIHSVPRPMAA
jgi:hypothetical protein